MRGIQGGARPAPGPFFPAKKKQSDAAVMAFVDENSAKHNVRLNGAWICAKETESFNVCLGRKRKCYCLASTDAKERRTEGSTDRPKLEK